MKRVILLAMVIATLAFSSCSEVKDGDWDPMEWYVNSSKKATKSPKMEVSAEGGEYIILCKNYTSFWLLNITVDNETIWTAADSDWSIENDWTSASTDFISLNASGKELKLNVEPNKTNQPHTIVVDIEAGDTFSSLTITQAAQ